MDNGGLAICKDLRIQSVGEIAGSAVGSYVRVLSNFATCGLKQHGFRILIQKA